MQRVERSSAFVQRRVRLPESADMTKIKAAYNNGTLTLDIPKAEVRSHACLSIAPALMQGSESECLQL